MVYKRFKTLSSVKCFDSKIKVIKDILQKDFSKNIYEQCDIYFVDDNPNIIFNTLNKLKSDNILHNKDYLEDNFIIYYFPTMDDEKNININLLKLAEDEINKKISSRSNINIPVKINSNFDILCDLIN